MATPISPSALVAWRTLVALGLHHDPERARQALTLWCRPSPPLSVADVAEVMNAVADQTGDHVYDRDDADQPQGTGRPWKGVRTNLED